MSYKIVNRRKRWATAAADAIGRVLFLPWSLRRRGGEIRPEEVREILVVRTAYIGDVVMTLPLLTPLKERFPAGRITLLTSTAAAPLAAGHARIDEVLAYNPFWFYPTGVGEYLRFMRGLRKRRWDLVIEARGDIREILLLVWPLAARHTVSHDVGGGGYLLTHLVPYGGLKHKVEYHLDIARHLGCAVGPLEWGLKLTEGELRTADERLRGAGVDGAFVAVHPGSRLPLKTWPAERYAALCDRLREHFGLPVVLLGAPEERAAVERLAGALGGRAVSLAGELDLRQLAAVLGRASLLVCNDSSPMHIAAALGTPTVAVFGPSKSVETAPYSPVGRVVERDYACRAGCDESTCLNARRPHGCMEDVTVAEVFAAAASLGGEVAARARA